MISKINGLYYTNLILYGIKNLERYRNVLNNLNVFPVPDGDTGTNMVMTLRYGYDTIKNKEGSLAEISQQFSSSAVFGARGNSGVIVSQFFKGLTEVFKDVKEADCEVFAKALQSGCKFAYASVSNPVEGTMLTVLKDASNAVIKSLPIQSINELIDVFLSNAKTSLANTPELLPILKKASVVDSGGSGIVYFFEGVKKCLNGEEIETTDAEEEIAVTEQIDLSIFNKDTDFYYGYCVEGLIQLKIDEKDFEFEAFKNKLAGYGNSVVVSLEGDKVKIHIHVKKLGNFMDFCQKYGEFLTIKIENMTVQNLQKEVLKQEAQKFLYNADREETDFAVIAVATNQQMQQCFFEMGADVVILSEIAPSSQDFMDAFKLANCKTY